jgi:hypothetical protein
VLAASRAYMTHRAPGQAWTTPDQRHAAARAAAERALFANLSPDGDAGPGGLPAGLSRFAWDLTYQAASGEMVLNVRSRTPLAFGALFRMSDAPFRTQSAATSKLKNLELALVLDNTGSMERLGKIGVLRTSTLEMIDTLKAASEVNPDRENALKIALVPFSMTVRLDDPARYRAADVSWLRGRPAHSSYDGVHDNVDRFRVHDQAGGWRGCVEVRPSAGDHDIKEDVNHGAGAYAPFTQPGGDPNAGCDMVPLRRLSRDMDGVKSAARSMTAVGNTNIPLGLIWGWHALSPRGNGPFGDGAPYGTENTLKAVVLMTDGMNHINPGPLPDGGPYSGLGLPKQGRIEGVTAGSSLGQRARAMDARLTKLCAAMKARDITIYTVRLMEGPQDVLRGCASGANKYFDVHEPGQLSAAFNQIAGDIIALRLSQ